MASWQLNVCSVSLAAGGSVLLLLLALRRWRRRQLQRRRCLLVPQYEKDKVYLFNFPSCRTIVTISPFALKVETWLRMRKIPHQTVRKLNVWSSKGQIPFAELNGEELNESNLMLRALAKHFDAEDKELTPEQLGQSRAMQMMLENRTALSYFYYRYVDDVRSFVDTWEYVGPLLRRIVCFTLPGYFRYRAAAFGFDRQSTDELYRLGNEDLLALSTMLGDKQFLFGDTMTTADCCAFAHLAQILYVPVSYPHKKFLREHAQNLCQYTERIREQLWPDWEEVSVNNVKGSD